LVAAGLASRDNGVDAVPANVRQGHGLPGLFARDHSAGAPAHVKSMLADSVSPEFSYLGLVVTISISAEALAAIAATLADDREAERRPDGKGAYFVTLPRDVLDKLARARATAT
jgi:hypothetical protein